MPEEPQDPYASLLSGAEQPPQNGAGADPYDQLDSEFQQTFGRPLRITGRDTPEHIRLHGKGSARDAGARDMSGDEVRFVLKRSRELGLEARDFSKVLKPYTTSTGVRISGPHVHMNRPHGTSAAAADDPYASLLGADSQAPDTSDASDPYASLLQAPERQITPIKSTVSGKMEPQGNLSIETSFGFEPTQTPKLTTDDVQGEQKFQQWYKERATKLGLDQNPDAPEHHYDYRAAFQAGAEPDETGHWPSQFKDATHPNRFVDGIDTITGERQPVGSPLEMTEGRRPAATEKLKSGPDVPSKEDLDKRRVHLNFMNMHQAQLGPIKIPGHQEAIDSYNQDVEKFNEAQRNKPTTPDMPSAGGTPLSPHSTASHAVETPLPSSAKPAGVEINLTDHLHAGTLPTDEEIGTRSYQGLGYTEEEATEFAKRLLNKSKVTPAEVAGVFYKSGSPDSSKVLVDRAALDEGGRVILPDLDTHASDSKRAWLQSYRGERLKEETHTQRTDTIHALQSMESEKRNEYLPMFALQQQEAGTPLTDEERRNLGVVITPGLTKPSDIIEHLTNPIGSMQKYLTDVGSVIRGAGKDFVAPIIKGVGRATGSQPLQDFGQYIETTAKEREALLGRGGTLGEIEQKAGGILPMLSTGSLGMLSTLTGVQSYGKGESAGRSVLDGALVYVGLKAAGAIAKAMPKTNLGVFQTFKDAEIKAIDEAVSSGQMTVNDAAAVLQTEQAKRISDAAKLFSPDKAKIGLRTDQIEFLQAEIASGRMSAGEAERIVNAVVESQVGAAGAVKAIPEVARGKIEKAFDALIRAGVYTVVPTAVNAAGGRPVTPEGLAEQALIAIAGEGVGLVGGEGKGATPQRGAIEEMGRSPEIAPETRPSNLITEGPEPPVEVIPPSKPKPPPPKPSSGEVFDGTSKVRYYPPTELAQNAAPHAKFIQKRIADGASSQQIAKEIGKPGIAADVIDAFLEVNDIQRPEPFKHGSNVQLKGGAIATVIKDLGGETVTIRSKGTDRQIARNALTATQPVEPRPTKEVTTNAGQEPSIQSEGGPPDTTHQGIRSEPGSEPGGGGAPGLRPRSEPTAGQRPTATAEKQPTITVEPGPADTIDAAAHEAATSPKNEKSPPSEGQIRAGNYEKGHYKIGDLDVSIENPEGSMRRPEWPALKSHYGYIRGTKGADGEQVDAFIAPGTPRDYSGPVFVVDQKQKNGKFDEHKAMLGFTDAQSARAGYLENYHPDFKGLAALTKFDSPADFRNWLDNADPTKPASETAGRYAIKPEHAAEVEKFKAASEEAERMAQEARKAPVTEGEVTSEEPAEVQGTEGIVKKLKENERRAQRAADTDEPTGLGNKNSWARARPHVDRDPETEVVVIDLNDLKQFNDQFGHDAGDKYLSHVAEGLIQASSARRAWRTGGDEMVAAVPKGQAQALVTALKSHAQKFKQGDITGSVAIGVGENTKLADKAMYQDKAAMKIAAVKGETPSETSGGTGSVPGVRASSEPGVVENVPTRDIEAIAKRHGNIHPRSVEKFYTAFDEARRTVTQNEKATQIKALRSLSEMLDAGNGNLRNLFAEESGVKLPKTAKDQFRTILDWAKAGAPLNVESKTGEEALPKDEAEKPSEAAQPEASAPVSPVGGAKPKTRKEEVLEAIAQKKAAKEAKKKAAEEKPKPFFKEIDVTPTTSKAKRRAAGLELIARAESRRGVGRKIEYEGPDRVTAELLADTIQKGDTLKNEEGKTVVVTHVDADGVALRYGDEKHAHRSLIFDVLARMVNGDKPKAPPPPKEPEYKITKHLLTPTRGGIIATEVHESFKVQMPDGTSNGQRWATEKEADTAARELESRWTGMPSGWKVVPSDDAVNYKWDEANYRGVPVKEGEPQAAAAPEAPAKKAKKPVTPQTPNEPGTAYVLPGFISTPGQRTGRKTKSPAPKEETAAEKRKRIGAELRAEYARMKEAPPSDSWTVETSPEAAEERAEFTWRPKRGYLSLNLGAIYTLNRVRGEGGGIRGLTFTRRTAEKYASRAIRLAEKATGIQHENLLTLAQVLRHTASIREEFAIVTRTGIVSRATIRHELTHVAQIALERFFAASLSVEAIQKIPLYENGRLGLMKAGYKAVGSSPQIIVHEIAAHIAVGQYKKTGLSLPQAMRFLEGYFEAMGRTYRADALKRFTDLTGRYQEVLYAVRQKLTEEEARRAITGAQRSVQAVPTGREKGDAGIRGQTNIEEPFAEIEAGVSRFSNELPQTREDAIERETALLEDYKTARSGNVKDPHNQRVLMLSIPRMQRIYRHIGLLESGAKAEALIADWEAGTRSIERMESGALQNSMMGAKLDNPAFDRLLRQGDDVAEALDASLAEEPMADLSAIPLPEPINAGLAEIARSFIEEGRTDFAELVNEFEELLGEELYEAVSEYLPDIVEAEEAAIAKEKEVTAERTGLLPGTTKLISMIRNRLESGEMLDNRKLTAMADEAFGGSRAAGTYNVQDATDALEVAVNDSIRSRANRLMIDLDPKARLAGLRELIKQLPRQADRTTEQIELQQFSTPPTEAFVAAKALAPTSDDIVLEPSAGTGSLAMWPAAVGAKVYVNEIDPRRNALLREQGFETTRVDAQFLDDLLPKDIQPTAILMNPPFSATGGRVKQNKTIYGAEHVSDALKRLAPNGRLVAIVGQSMTLAARDNESSSRGKVTGVTMLPWWREIMKQYNVRANILVPGEEYAKYGTTFGNQILVIDKTGPTPGADFQDQLGNVVRLQPKDLEGVLDALEAISKDRPQIVATNLGETGPDIRGGVGKPEATGQASGRGESGGTGNKPGSTPNAPRPSGTPQGSGPIPASESIDQPQELGEAPAIQGSGGTGPDVRRQLTDAGITTGRQTAVRERESATFVEYRPAKFHGGVKHPGNIVESASMASVDPPDITYTPQIDPQIVVKGRLSDLQYEAVIYAGQRHEQRLPNGARAAYYTGDGTGVGKGRIISGVGLDNWTQGRKRILWLSVNNDLVPSTRRDFADLLGIDPLDEDAYNKAAAEGKAPSLAVINDFAASDKTIQYGDGVLFASYASLIRKARNGQSRLDQIVEWLGEDGVLMFDEAHKAKNAITTGMKEASQTGGALLDLQQGDKSNPNWRIMFASATGATDVDNMGYMARLGLWGEGTSFPGGFPEFRNAISTGGVGAMEMVCRDMKAMGMYRSVMLSYKGVDYQEATHILTDTQMELYDIAARAWQLVLENFEKAFDTTNAGPHAKMHARRRFWNDQQRFFRQFITALKVPTAITEIEKAIDKGNSVILGLYGTGEARTKDQVKKALAAGSDLDDLDFSPKEILRHLVERAFPTQRYTEAADPNDPTKIILIPVVDEQGQPVESAAAVAMKNAMLEEIDKLSLPDNPLDQIINHFGPNAVAEITGRKKRLQINPETGKTEYVKRVEGASMEKASQHEMDAFQDGRKRIAIISASASTGISLHADNTRKNKQRRTHITLETGWSADIQMQTFGRSHRSNQAQPPEYVLLSTNIGGEKRFLSTIAQRLASLGALTKGERKATGVSSEGNEGIEKYDFLNDYGRAAVHRVFNGADIEIWAKMGLVKDTPNGKVMQEPDVERFLNRVLALEITDQNAMFDQFMDEFENIVAMAKADGTFDAGVTDIEAEAIRIVGEPTVVAKEKTTGAETIHYELEIDEKTHPVDWEQAEAMARRFRTDEMETEPSKIIRRTVQGELYEGDKADFYGAPAVFNVTAIRKAAGYTYDVVAGTNAAGESYEQPLRQLSQITPGPRVVKVGPGFYKQKISGHIILATPTGSRTDPHTGVVVKRVHLTRPNGALSSVINRAELAEKYEPIEGKDAQTLWTIERAAVPDVRTKTVHVIGGAIIPVWQRLQTRGATLLKVVRVETEKGERIVGVRIPNKAIAAVLAALGVKSKDQKPEDVFNAVLNDATINLTSNLTLKSARFKGNKAIVLSGFDRYKLQELKNLGLRHEIINYTDKLLIPTDPDIGIPILTRLLERYPVIEAATTGAIDISEDDEGHGGTTHIPRRGGSPTGLADWFRAKRNAITGAIPTDYSGLLGGAGKRTAEAWDKFKNLFVRNLSHLERTSPEAHTFALRAGSSRGQATILMSIVANQIDKALEGSGISWEMFAAGLVESRLRGVRERYLQMSLDAFSSDDAELIEALENGMMDVLKHIEGRAGLDDTLAQRAATLADQGEYDDLRNFLGAVFEMAADRTGRVDMGPDPNAFEQLTTNPRYEAALRLYKDYFEAPLAESHAINEGVFSDSLGPLETYYPLIAVREEGGILHRLFGGTKFPFRKPRNIANYFPTGLATHGYSLEMSDLGDRIRAAIKTNNKAALLSELDQQGLIRVLGRNERAPGTGGTYEMMQDGEMVGAQLVDTGSDLLIVRPEGNIRVPGARALVPNWLHKELKPILDKEKLEPGMGDGLINAIIHASLIGPMDLAWHSFNIIGTLVANTPFIGQSIPGAIIGGLPFTKVFNVIIQIARTDPMSEESLRDLIEMANIGLVPPRYGSIASKWLKGGRRYARLTGVKTSLFFGPMLYGPKGLDIRARLVLYRAAKMMNPGAQQLFKFVTQLGVYNRELESGVERFWKATRLAPFATAGMTMWRNGLNAWTGTGPKPVEGFGRKAAYFTAQQLSGGAAALIALWALAYFAYRKKWPWDKSEPEAKLFKIPVKDEDRDRPGMNSLFGPDKTRTAYFDFSFFSPIVSRGSRAIGVAGAFEARALGGTPGQMSEYAQRDIYNSLLHPFASGPLVRTPFIFLTGKEPSLASLRDVTGNAALEFYPATIKAEPGLATWKERTKEALFNVNPFAKSIAGAAGVGEQAERNKNQQITGWARILRMATDVVAPRLIGNTVDVVQQEARMAKQAKAAGSKEGLGKAERLPDDVRLELHKHQIIPSTPQHKEGESAADYEKRTKLGSEETAARIRSLVNSDEFKSSDEAQKKEALKDTINRSRHDSSTAPKGEGGDETSLRVRVKSEQDRLLLALEGQGLSDSQKKTARVLIELSFRRYQLSAEEQRMESDERTERSKIKLQMIDEDSRTETLKEYLNRAVERAQRKPAA